MVYHLVRKALESSHAQIRRALVGSVLLRCLTRSIFNFDAFLTSWHVWHRHLASNAHCSVDLNSFGRHRPDDLG